MSADGGEATQVDVTPLRATPLPAPPLARIELAFEYTFEELREGLTSSPHAKATKPPASASKGLFGCVLFIGLAVALFMLLNSSANRARRTPTPAQIASPGQVDLVIAAVPSMTAALAAGIFVITLATATLRLTSSQPNKQKNATTIIVAGLVLIIGVIMSGLFVFTASWAVDRWLVPRPLTMIFAIAPWALVFLGSGYFVIWMSRSQLRRQWDTKPYLKRRRTIMLDSVGEQSADEMTTTFYRWPFFRRAWETENVLVLLDENDARHVLPKRVMDQMTLDRARALISNHVVECTFQVAPGGFPVGAAGHTS